MKIQAEILMTLLVMCEKLVGIKDMIHPKAFPEMGKGARSGLSSVIVPSHMWLLIT